MVDPARFNLFWFLSLAAPCLIVTPAAYFARSLRSNRLRIAVAAALALTWWLSVQSLERRWVMYMERARTDAELTAATTDGAQRIAWALIGAPAEAVVSTVVWGVIGWQLGRRRRAGVGIEAPPEGAAHE